MPVNITIRAGESKKVDKKGKEYRVELVGAHTLRGRVKLPHHPANSTTLHLRGHQPKPGDDKGAYVIDLTCAKVGKADHLYAVVLPLNTTSGILRYDMLRGDFPIPISSPFRQAKQQPPTNQ